MANRFVLLALATLLLAAGANASAKTFCRQMSSTSRINSFVGNFTFSPALPTCTEFYSGGKSAIIAPADSAAASYGVVSAIRGSTNYTFTDRLGATFQFAITLLPEDIQAALKGNSRLFELFLFKANLNRRTRTISSISLAVYVPVETMVLPWAKTSFTGKIFNYNPEINVTQGAVTRFSFGDTIVTNPYRGQYSSAFPMLPGKILNWNKSIRVRNTCVPPLCASNNTDCQWYQKFWGEDGNIGIYWDPAMHAPGDTEMVIVFSNGVSYMSRGQRIIELLRARVKVTDKVFTFIVHGTPVNTLQHVAGKFTKAGGTQNC